MTGTYNRAGEPISREEWSRLFADADYQRIAWTELEGDVHVSTVWMGLDHQFGDGPPLIFETMIFGGKYDQWQWRYPTAEAALAGHDQAVAHARDAVRQ